MIKPDNIFAALTPFTLYTHQLARVDVVTVLRRVGASVSATRNRCHRAGISIHLTEQHTATLVRIGLFAVAANLVISWLANLQHRISNLRFSNFRLFCKLAIGNRKSEISILLPKTFRSNTYRQNRKGWSQIRRLHLSSTSGPLAGSQPPPQLRKFLPAVLLRGPIAWPSHKHLQLQYRDP